MVRGKCHCGKRAMVEFLIVKDDAATTIKLCEKCEPKPGWGKRHMTEIDRTKTKNS